MATGDEQQKSNSSTRLDKWLWATRFYKTRAIAKQKINSWQSLLGDSK